MFDRRLVTDVALAALIAFPAALPASQSMRSALIDTAGPPAVAHFAAASSGGSQNLPDRGIS